MTKQEQDKLWAELSDESRERIRKEYVDIFVEKEEEQAEHGKSEWWHQLTGKRKMLRGLYGAHNLQPSLTYEAVARELLGSGYCYYDYVYDEIVENSAACEMPMACTSRKQVEKICALNKLLNVAKFLNKNEDGSDWIAKLDDTTQEKWTIHLNTKGQLEYSRCACLFFSVVYFKSEDDCNKAVQILGEDVIKLALTPDY